MENYIHIGKVAAAHGLKGEIILLHSLGKKTKFVKGDVVFIEKVKGSYLPFFVESALIKSPTETIVLFEGIETRESANSLVSKKAWITENDFFRLADKNAPIGLLDFSVIENGNLLGKVIEIIEQPHQVMAVVMHKNKEVYIPIHNETLITINRNKKEIHVKLPEGLLEIYLDEA